MSKYDKLWQYIYETGEEKVVLSFNQIEGITGFKIDHSFLNSKKELLDYGYKVDKISMKEKTIMFIKIA